VGLMSHVLPLDVPRPDFRYRDRSEPAIKGLTFAAERGEILLIGSKRLR